MNLLTFYFFILTVLRELTSPPPKRTSFGWTSKALKGPSPVYGRRRIAFVIFNDHVLKMKILQPKTDRSNGEK